MDTPAKKAAAGATGTVIVFLLGRLLALTADVAELKAQVQELKNLNTYFHGRAPEQLVKPIETGDAK